MKWLKGLLGAFIGGAANAITLMGIDPASFNFNDGVGKLGTAALLSGIVSGALYIKQSPIK